VRHLLRVQVAIWIVLNLFSAMSTAAQSYAGKAAPNEKHQRHRVTAWGVVATLQASHIAVIITSLGWQSMMEFERKKRLKKRTEVASTFGGRLSVPRAFVFNIPLSQYSCSVSSSSGVTQSTIPPTLCPAAAPSSIFGRFPGEGAILNTDSAAFSFDSLRFETSCSAVKIQCLHCVVPKWAKDVNLSQKQWTVAYPQSTPRGADRQLSRNNEGSDGIARAEVEEAMDTCECSDWRRWLRQILHRGGGEAGLPRASLLKSSFQKSNWNRTTSESENPQRVDVLRLAHRLGRRREGGRHDDAS